MSTTDHLTEAELAAVAHGEAPRQTHRERPARRATVEAHLAQCDACRAAVDALRRDDATTAQLLRLVDHAPPPDAFAQVLAAARGRQRRSPHLGLGRIAAAGLFTAAAAAAALPHSPLRRLLAGTSASAAARRPVAQTPAPAVPTPDSARAGAGIALVPGPRLEVQFLRPGTGNVVVRLSDAPLVALQPRTGTAAFAVRADRIVVDDTTARASFELVVPRGLGHLQVRIDTAVFFERDAARIVTRARPGATGDTYTLDCTVARGPRDTPVTRP